ncbi:MAG TPA: helix-turn-helix domain-containing protein [Solirubrobacteraceae bacterium]|jgi:AcrR family transcriptional regulator|nr:helix-turn-helix domain-containing protein [Solirubrobacteraceae bacterium]
MEARTTARWTRRAPEDRRAAILEAAQQVFADAPYDAVNMADVAGAAGISRALVNHYFGSKRELFIATLRSVTAAGPEVVRTDLELPVEEMVARNTDAWLDHVERNVNTSLAIAGVGPFGDDPEAAEMVAQIRDEIVDRMLLNHFGPVEIAPTVRLALRAYTGLFEVAARDWLVTGRATREQVRVLLVQCLLAIVREAAPRLAAHDQVTNRIVSG